MDDLRIPDLPPVTSLDGTELVPLSQDGQTKRTTSADMGLTFTGDASDQDTDGNPTPDPSVYPPADYAEGVTLRAPPGSFPATLDNGDTFLGGDMWFRRTGSSGSEAWEWVSGSYRASNSNGEYRRSADGEQVCTHNLAAGSVAIDQLNNGVHFSAEQTWTYPASFTTLDQAQATVLGGIGVWAGDITVSAGTSSLPVRLFAVSSHTSHSSTALHLKATGAWK